MTLWQPDGCVKSVSVSGPDVPFAWVTADEAYGQVKYLRVWLGEHAIADVLAAGKMVGVGVGADG